MKKTLLTTLLISTLTLGSSSAIEIKLTTDSTKSERVKLWINGRIDVYSFVDTYQTVDLFHGLQYITAARPVIDPTTMEDLSHSGELRFNVASTRLGIGSSYDFNERNGVMGYVEGDFINPNGSSLLGFRLRHAYIQLTLGSSQLLFGQTTHLSLYEEIAAPTVTFGGGYPYSILSRPIQFRFTQNFLDGKLKLDAAASMFWGEQFEWQADAMTPDLSIRLTLGRPKTNTLAIFGGYKSLMPQNSLLAYSKARVNAFYGGAMGKLAFDRIITIRAGVIYGGDLSTLGLSGGFAPSINLDTYHTVNTLSTWIDLSSDRYYGFEFGLFGGFQQNLGANSPIALNELQSVGLTYGIDNYWALSPRVWYNYKMLYFGLEYTYSQANWMNSSNDQYRPSADLSVAHNNRVTLLCRFVF